MHGGGERKRPHGHYLNRSTPKQGAFAFNQIVMTKFRYQVSQWKSWPIDGKIAESDKHKFVLSECPWVKDEAIFFEADSVEEIIRELPGMGIDIDSVFISVPLSEWATLKGVTI